MANKTPEEIIQSIRVNKANLDHIASTNKINGSLFVDFKRCLEEYGKQQYKQGILDAAEKAKRFVCFYNEDENSGNAIEESLKKPIKQ